MKITNVARKLCYAFAFALKFRSIRIGFMLAYFDVTLSRTLCARRLKGEIQFSRTGNTIPATALSRYKQSIKYLFHILNTPGVRIKHSDHQSIKLSVDGVIFRVHSMSNVFALYEIFCDRIYEITLPERPYVALDIGMNVGVASLYFASRKEIKAVVGYEPFAESFLEAECNISLNPALASKLRPRKLGVSSVSETRRVILSESGLLSASTLNNDAKPATRQTHMGNITVISIHEVFGQINSEFPDFPIIMKMDCEGEEYKIFESLEASDLLRNVSVAIIEWHQRGADPIIKVLKAKGYHALNRASADGASGLIYAFRS